MTSAQEHKYYCFPFDRDPAPVKKVPLHGQAFWRNYDILNESLSRHLLLIGEKEKNPWRPKSTSLKSGQQLVSACGFWNEILSCDTWMKYCNVPFPNLGLDVTEHQIASLDLHDHLLRPQATFGIKPLQLGHAVLHRLQLPAVQLTGEQVLWRARRADD